MINWKVRIKNKLFWLSLIPALLLLIEVVASLFGVSLELGEIGNKLKETVNALFAVLSLTGIVLDPTTEGFSDSPQALLYEKPRGEKR